MTYEDRIKSIERRHPERIPVSASILPAAWIKHRDALDEIVRRHPLVFGPQPASRDYDAIERATYVAGEHVDVWGCVWSNVKSGMEAIVTGHPVPNREAIPQLQIPTADDGMPHGFMYLRLQDLRGFEALMLDFAEEPPELQLLIDKVLQYNIRQVQLRLAAIDKPNQIVTFGDDLGMQQRLPIRPAQWRQYLKPCYHQIYEPVRQAGHYVYMHSDGHILEIIPDLIDCGVNVINPQVGANGLENLAEVCGDRICIDLDLDRQMFPLWGPAEIEAHVREAVEILGQPEGGLWLKAEIGEDVPLENVEAICTAMETYSRYFQR